MEMQDEVIPITVALSDGKETIDYNFILHVTTDIQAE